MLDLPYENSHIRLSEVWPPRDFDGDVRTSAQNLVDVNHLLETEDPGRVITHSNSAGGPFRDAVGRYPRSCRPSWRLPPGSGGQGSSALGSQAGVRGFHHLRSGGVSLDFGRVEVLTFDCYGTLIDWERGILEALRPMMANAEVAPLADEDLLELFGRLEAEAEAGPFRCYRAVLTAVALRIADEIGIEISAGEADAFAASVPAWPAFSDTVPALRALGRHYRLAIVSNVDDDLFEASSRHLEVPFDEVVTAEQVASYKPAHAHFLEVVERLGVPRDRVLHVAQSLYHDIEPARDLGIRSVWVNRRAGRLGGGATRASGAEPDLEVPDLRTLVRVIGA